MHDRKFVIPYLVLALLLGGCATSRLIKEGDRNMSANRPGGAVRFYEKAIGKKPNLVNNKKFMTKLQRANCLAAYEEGQALASKGQWDQAVGRFSDSLKIDPEFSKARTALRYARQQAAIVHHKEAISNADNGNLRGASSELRLALQMDPNNTDVQTALGSLGATRTSPAQNAYELAKEMQKERKWLRAAEVLSEAVKQHPNDILCRVELYGSRRQLEQAKKLRTEGIQLGRERRLDKAMATLVQAKGIWPFIEQVDEPLAKARAERDQAEEFYRQATALAEKSDWPAVIEKAQAGLAVFPFHEGIIAVLAQAKHQTAQKHLQEGRSLLKEGQSPEADRAFYKALEYVPDMSQAQQGVAEIAFQRGSKAEQAGLWGEALVWYTEAIDHHDTDQYQRQKAAMREKIVERIGYSLAVEVTDGHRRVSADAATLQSKVLDIIARKSPEYLWAESGHEHGSWGDYQASLDIREFDVDSRIIRSDNRVHNYTIYQDVPNPEIPRILGRLESARQRLRRMRHQVNQPCYACQGKGKVKCSACSGKGKSDCPRCHGSGQVNCGKCRGSGRNPDVDHKDVRRQERKVQGLEGELRRTPSTISQGFRAQWPYTVEHHEKKGVTEVGISIADTSTAEVFHRDAIGKRDEHRDSTIQNPNPSIGLKPNDLNLPADAEVRRRLMDQIALQGSSRVLKAVINKRIAETHAKIDHLRQEQKDAQALEAEADLASLLGARDPKAAAEIINRLRAELRSGTRLAAEKETPR